RVCSTSGQPDTAGDEESAPLGRVQIDRRGDIGDGLRYSLVGAPPAVDRPADEQVAAGRAAEFHEPGDAADAGAVRAVVTRDVGRAIAQAEADPEAVTALRVLRPRRGRRAGERGDQCDDSRCVHAALPFPVTAPGWASSMPEGASTRLRRRCPRPRSADRSGTENVEARWNRASTRC